MKQKRRKRRKPANERPRRNEPPASGLLRRRYLLFALPAVAIVVFLGWWAFSRSAWFGTRQEPPEARGEPSAEVPGLRIRCPFDESVFPPEIAPARFFWDDGTAGVDRWKIEIAFDDGEAPMQFETQAPEWSPPTDAWDRIKERSTEAPAHVAICGVGRRGPDEVLSRDEVSIRTSSDEVGAPIFYREVNLPFADAVKDPGAHIRWRFGSVASKEQPPVVMEKMPLCGNCHSFSADGALIGMDVDYGNDKGSYVLCPVSREMVYDNAKIITWSDYKRDDNRGTLGLLSQVSPDGRYALSTVKDRSVFAAVDDLAFSQLFFPIQGILAYYDRRAESFHALPGADDPRYVQSNPTWSPDGKYVVFARSEAYHSEAFREKRRGLTGADDVSEFLEGGKTFRFDLWRVPFNGGKGGEAEPLEGASNNGMSNYFPKYSPDGKWIVLCRAKSFMLLQPDSALYIIPAEGGRARRLECNTRRMNSWHSWSPNGKWLVFSSKAYSPYTQLFLTHVDDDGRTTPPVVLAHFTASDRAANIPEFVNAPPDAIRTIRAEFIDDLSFFQAAKWNVHDGNYKLAIRDFRRALEINPKNVKARVALASVLLSQGSLDEAEAELSEIVSLDPENPQAHVLRGSLWERRGNFAKAMESYRHALRIDRNDASAHQSMGRLALTMGATEEGRKHLAEAVRLDPDHASPCVDLASSFLRQRRPREAVAMYREALRREPDSEAALVGLAIALMQHPERRPRHVEEAAELAARACALTGDKNPAALVVMAEACAATGRLPEAVSAAQKALDLARQLGKPDLAARVRTLLEKCEARMPTP